MYIGKLNQIYNNRYHRTIRMKSIDVNSSAYFDFDVGNNDEDPEFIYKLYIYVGNYVIISKQKIPWTYVIENLSGEEIVGTFYEKELQKTNQIEFRIEKVIKK